MSFVKYNIGIAGAGIAGLAAGILLQQAGHQVTMLESRSVPGGRIQSLVMNGFHIEAGPEFIHGHAKETIRLLKKYNIPFVPCDGKMYTAYNGHFQEEEEMITGWQDLLEQMQNLKMDLPFGEFLNKYFPGAEHKDLRHSAVGFAEGFDLVDIKTASTKALAIEWLAGESGQYRISVGYYSLIQSMEKEFISAGGKILFHHAVESVDCSLKNIHVSVKGFQPLVMDKFLICLPVGMLNPSATAFEGITLNPPPEQLNTFAQIGIGSVIKLVTIWKSSFWKTQIPDAHFIFSNGFIPTWWTQFPLDLPILTGWLGGPQAEILSPEPDEFFLERALETLAAVFSKPVSELKNILSDFKVFNWRKEMWSRGAYSYATVKSFQSKISSLKSWQRRIYFAGEAIYEGAHPGTVESALVSGLDAANLLLAEI